jgi:lipopolysaccharide transport system permease protein
LVGVFVWFRIMPPTTTLLFPLGITSLTMIGFMIGILLTPLGLLYNDIQQMIPIMTIFLMFLTPVIYPQPKTGLAGVITKWNPLTPLITTTRDWITLGTTSELFGFMLVCISTLCLLFLGWVIYRLALPHIIARIGN